MVDEITVEAAIADACAAALEFDAARAWLKRTRREVMAPLAAEVWVTDPSFSYVLLVRHRTRGWVPPGGTVESGETPRAAAARELAEETGVRSELLPEPAAVAVRSFRADWAPTLSLSYAAVVNHDVPLIGEAGQPPRWFGLTDEWDSVFPADVDRIREYVHRPAVQLATGER